MGALERDWCRVVFSPDARVVGARDHGASLQTPRPGAPRRREWWSEAEIQGDRDWIDEAGDVVDWAVDAAQAGYPRAVRPLANSGLLAR